MFVFNDTSTTDIYTLSLHDALPICAEMGEQIRRCFTHIARGAEVPDELACRRRAERQVGLARFRRACLQPQDRKSTRLNSSHANISYAVFCLKKKNISSEAHN